MYDLTRNETLLVCDALKGVSRRLEDPDVSLLNQPVIEVERAIQRYGLDQKWQVDPQALSKKLFMLGESETRALVEAVRRFWEYAEPTIDNALRAAGLH